MNLIYEYIKYLAKGQGRHQVHSPFVFDFVDVCLRGEVAQTDKIKFKTFQQSLLTDKNKYLFDRFGAGSKKGNKPKTISEYSKNASTFGKYWKLLYLISNHYKPKNILELGTNFGFGTLALHLGFPNSKITTIEGSKTLFDINNKSFKSTDFKTIEFINNSFEAFFQSEFTIKYDLVFLDGDHRGKAVLDNLNQILKHTHDQSIIIIDDIRWSNDMFDTWKQIIDDKRFHLTLDLFRMGIVIPLSTKEKEHFIIRY
jgi:predicted O-methyltransferase YrrM